MVSKIDTLERLNEEKDYEDKLIENLTYYFINCLPDIIDITKKEERIIKEKLELIQYESSKHSNMFSEMIQMVMLNEEDNF